MAVLSNVFYAILFLSMASGVFTIALLFLTHVLGLNPPLWASVGGMLLYCVPVLAPDVVLFSPEPQMWYRGFYVACGVWALGVGALLLRHIVRSLLAWRAVNSYPLCGDQRLEDICARSTRLVGIKRVPRLCFGTLAEPACAAGILRPAIILDRRIAGALSDGELLAVFCHELTHLKRRHLLLERAFDLVCVLNWMNPLVWLARRDFALGCETDCDRRALAAAEGVLPKPPTPGPCSGCWSYRPSLPPGPGGASAPPASSRRSGGCGPSPPSGPWSNLCCRRPCRQSCSPCCSSSPCYSAGSGSIPIPPTTWGRSTARPIRKPRKAALGFIFSIKLQK